MKIQRSATLPAGVDEAFALVSTEDYQQAKVQAQVPTATASVTPRADGGVEVHTERRLATAGMPGPVVSMVGDTLTITEHQDWGPELNGAREARLRITVAGVPMSLAGTITLSPEGAESRIVIDADLSCTIPLLGRKLEEAARPTIEDSIAHEVEQLTTRLS